MRLLAGLVGCALATRTDPIAVIPLRVENSALVTDAISVNGGTFTLLVDVNSADLILPVCTPRAQSDQCYDPTKSGGFRYCAGDSFCFDRQEPKFACDRTVPASEWSIDTSALTAHKLSVDGVAVNATTFEFIESVRIGNDWKGSVAAKGAVDFKRPVLGLGPDRLSCRTSTLASALGASYWEIQDGSLSLYAQPPAGTSFSKHYQLVPTNSSVMLGRYAFNMFHPTVCGTDILGNVSSHWSVIVDPTTECLVLPDFMVNNLKAWKLGSDGFLYFSLSDDGENEGGMVAMDLSNVCVQSIPSSESEPDFGMTGNRPIVLGYRAIQALGKIGFEAVQPYRLGFSSSPSGSTACTTPAASCAEAQTYHAASNACVDPRCEDYLFSELDKATKSCVWKPYSAYLVYGTVLVLVVGELALHRLRRKTLQLAQASCERDDPPAT